MQWISIQIFFLVSAVQLNHAQHTNG